ncbi:hypothetical protein ASZ78_016069 [Callipepla squamata]|uniref:E3 ubiquitin-protein ligase E3D n=1 Tax=Callipepla squamata TaxID=9009 RepID=A0A226NE53_CALSU|nr:hypothetical protein ASZ78_016069 [Callipepla squamata]
MACAFLLEVRRGTESAALVIREASLRSLPADVSVFPGRLEVRSGAACVAAALPPGVSVAPSSCRGLRLLPGDGLHLRLRLRGTPRAPELVYDLKESLKPQKNCIFYCQSCGNVVVKERYIKDVYFEFVSWEYFETLLQMPKIEITRTTFHHLFIDSFWLEGNQSYVPESPKCSSDIGHHASQDDSTLIWLLNSDTLLVESLGSSSSQSLLTLFGDDFMPSSGRLGMWNAVKVLYQPCIKNRNKDLADAWENDFGVHPLKLPSETCLELLLMLSSCTASLPSSLQSMNSFQTVESQIFESLSLEILEGPKWETSSCQSMAALGLSRELEFAFLTCNFTDLYPYSGA